MRGRWELNDAQWELIEPILRPKRRSDGKGRPWQDTRAVLNGVPNLPPPLQPVGRGEQTGRHLARASRAIARTRETGTGGGFYRRLLHGSKKGGLAVGPRKRGKRTKILAICTDHSLPLAVGIQSASPHESQVVEEVLGQSFLDELPERLIGAPPTIVIPWTICGKPTISS
jgi:hypothetical protein